MARRCAAALAPLAALLLAPGVHAQGSACDQLKATLSARIDPSIRGFALDTVPAATPVPPGAKVIGTCEGGAYKILFRRSGGAAPSAAGSAAMPPAPAPLAAKPRAVEAVAALAPPPAVVVVESTAPPPSPPPSPAPATSPPPEPASADGPSLAERVLGFFSRYAYGFAALALVILGPALWRWVVYRRTYDASGLPRGPRIR